MPASLSTPANAPATYALSLSQNRPLRFTTFFYLYVMQGVPAGFANTALANYLAAEGISSDRIGTFVATVGLPWAFQFVWGPLIDRFQGSPMGRRRPWVVGAQLLAFVASLGMLFINDPASNLSLLATAFLVHSVCASIQDASVDAMAISTIPAQERGRINAFMRGGFLSGTAMGAAGLSFLLRSEGFQTAALVQSLFLLALTITTFFIKENATDALLPGQSAAVVHRNTHQHTIGWLFRELFRGLTTRSSLRLFLPIVVVYSCQNAFIRAYNVHLIQQLGWTDTAVSVLSGTYGIILIVGVVLVGGWLADRFGARRLLVYVMGIHATYLIGLNLLAPYWSNVNVATAGEVLWHMMDPSLSVAAIPILMALCRPDVEGSQFTTYMALVNLSDIIGAFVSGHAQRYVSAPTIGLIAGGIVVVALLVAARSIQRERHPEAVE